MTPTDMHIKMDSKYASLRNRLEQRLARVAQLRCDDHGQPVQAVVIDARENGWFDSRWTTCCEHLEEVASQILGNRC